MVHNPNNLTKTIKTKEDAEEYFDDFDPDNYFIAFNAKHLIEEIEGINLYHDSYTKEKIKTYTVALVLCLNVGVDPPDVQKLSPCCRMEAWYDPTGKIPLKALEKIGHNLQAQYERWQPRARYKLCLDPTMDEVKKLCQSLRRNAKDDRVLFHYNGHGVPKPTDNSEIWVFNKTYTKYIPLSIYDLQTWMGSPSVYVFDCNNAQRTIRLFESFCNKRQDEAAGIVSAGNNSNNRPPVTAVAAGVTPTPSIQSQTGGRHPSGNQPQSSVPVTMESTIILAACRENEELPMNPDIPSDLFTACLTTPIIMAVRWYWLKHRERFPGLIDEEMLNRIPGSYSNRQSMLGELNWVFTAVTDTIAWSCLPMELFQKLFRQDMLVASLFRNFLLADLIMRSYGVNPVSHPILPETHNHPMWAAWDHALDNFLEQLPNLVGKKSHHPPTSNGEQGNDVTDCLLPHPPKEDSMKVPLSTLSNYGENSDDEEEEEEEDSEEDDSELEAIHNNKTTAASSSTIPPQQQWEIEKRKKVMQPQHPLVSSGRPGAAPVMGKPVVVQRPAVAPNRRGIHVNFEHQYLAGHNSHLQSRAAGASAVAHHMLPSQQQHAVAHHHQLLTHSPGITNLAATATQPATASSGRGGGNSASTNQIMTDYRHTNFFSDQLTAFEVWLATACELKPGALQLPVLLQVLLSQVHRIRALELLSKYVDLGPWAVSQALSVGIFPYMVRLLQSPVSEVKPLLVFIWCKIIASAETDFARNDVVKDSGLKYFISTLTDSEQTPRTRTMGAFVLAKMLDKNPDSHIMQDLLQKENIICVIQGQLFNNPPDLNTENFIRLRLWLILCLMKMWSKNDRIRWYGIRNKVQESLFPYLKDVSPEVRAATVCALGTFLDNHVTDPGMTDHATQVAHTVAQHLLQEPAKDGSPLVRRELVVALCALVRQFEPQFIAMATQYMDEMRLKEERDTQMIMLQAHVGKKSAHIGGGLIAGGLPKVSSQLEITKLDESNKLRKVGSSSNFFTTNNSIPFTNIYAQLWRCLMNLTRDPFHDVSNMSKIIVGRIRKKIFEKAYGSNTIPRSGVGRFNTECKTDDPQSIPGSPVMSPNTRPRPVIPSSPQTNLPHSVQYPTRRAFGDASLYVGGHIASKMGSQELPADTPESTVSPAALSDDTLLQVGTDLFGWCARYFVQCQLRPLEDKESALYMSRIERLKIQNDQNKVNRRDWINCSEQTTLVPQQVFIQRNSHCPLFLRFHPHQNELMVADKSGVSVWDYNTGNQLQYLVSRAPAGVELLTNPPPTPLMDSLESRVSAMELMNCDEESGLVMTGSDDGAIRIWRNYAKYMGQDPEMVTAWIALTDMLQSNRTAGLVTHWSQSSGQLAVSGDVKIVRLWDSIQEARMADIPTMADSCVTCLERSRDDRLMFAGFGDGTVRMFDVRSSSPCVITGGQGDSGWIHTVKLNSTDEELYTVGHRGTISTWSISYMSSMAGKDAAAARRREALVGRPNGTRSFTKVNQVIPSFRQKHSVYCADIKVDIGAARNGLAVMGMGSAESREVSLIRTSTAQVMSTLKFYDGFSRENIGVPSCVTFHPTLPLVAMGFNDSMLLMLNLKSK